MHGPLYEKKGMIVTTFASHIERVQAIADIAKKATGKFISLEDPWKGSVALHKNRVF